MQQTIKEYFLAQYASLEKQTFTNQVKNEIEEEKKQEDEPEVDKVTSPVKKNE